MARDAARRAQEAAAGEQRRAGLRRRDGAVDDGHLAPEHLGDGAGEERIVRAAEHRRVDAAPPQIGEIALGHQPRHLSFRPALLGQRHEERTGARHHAGERSQPPQGRLVCARGDGRGRSQHGDGSAAGPGRRRLRARLDDTDDRNRQRILQDRQAVRRDGVAGDHQRLDAVGDEVPRREQGVAGHHLARARAVGNARGVAEIDGVLVGKPLDERPQHGQTADAAVEDADGRAGVHAAADITASLPP